MFQGFIFQIRSLWLTLTSRSDLNLSNHLEAKGTSAQVDSLKSRCDLEDHACKPQEFSVSGTAI